MWPDAEHLNGVTNGRSVEFAQLAYGVLVDHPTLYLADVELMAFGAQRPAPRFR
jgi:hypothetical protein